MHPNIQYLYSHQPDILALDQDRLLQRDIATLIHGLALLRQDAAVPLHQGPEDVILDLVLGIAPRGIALHPRGRGTALLRPLALTETRKQETPTTKHQHQTTLEQEGGSHQGAIELVFDKESLHGCLANK